MPDCTYTWEGPAGPKVGTTGRPDAGHRCHGRPAGHAGECVCSCGARTTRPGQTPPAHRAHARCWTGTGYEHTCHRPSGLACRTCGAPAGTLWTPYWCPPCDRARLEAMTVELIGTAA